MGNNESCTQSIELYKNLLSLYSNKLRQFMKNLPLHKRQLTFDAFNEQCYIIMYENQRRKKQFLPRQNFFGVIPNLQAECYECWKFYLNPRNEFVKKFDIILGRQFEDILIDFLNKHQQIFCQRAAKGGNYPDIEVLNKYREKVIAYCELKYLTAPFVKIFEKNPGRECYEGSTTLDVGDKIKAQRKIVETKIKVPVFYVYWLDYPCIKGIFYMPAERVYQYIDKVGIEWRRHERAGDFIESGNKKIRVGELNKVYLPLLEMGNFKEFIDEIKFLYGDKNV